MQDMNNLEFNKFYDNLTEEEILFYSLKYNRCKYRIEYSTILQTNLIDYDEPESWPAFYVMDLDDGPTRVGIFTSKKKINLAYIDYNKE